MSVGRSGLVYGSGALRAAARGDRIMWALHRAALTSGIAPIVPAVAIADGFRTEARGDRLNDLLDGSEVESMSEVAAQRAGELASKVPTTDIVAATVADTAARHNCAVVASRQNALSGAASLLGHKLVLYAV